MSWRKEEKNKYIVEVEKRINGKRKRKKERIETALKGKDLEFFMKHKEQELLKLLSSERRADMSEYTFKEFAEYYIETSSASIRTLDHYKQYLRLRTYDYFGHMKLRKIEPYHIEDFFLALRKEVSKETGKKLSPKTIQHYRDLLRAIFNKAVSIKIIEENPTKGIVIPKVIQNIDDRYYEIEEIQEILTAFQEEGNLKYLTFFCLDLFTGARPSEIYGLKWEKINFETGKIKIDEALVYTQQGYIQKTTKTEDRRVQQLSPFILSLLKDLKEMERSKHKTKNIGKEYVFTNPDGGHLGTHAYRTFFKRFCNRNKIRYVPPYGLRHTSGTLLSASNVPLPNISGHLGHLNRSTTDKYIHQMKSADEQIQDVLTRATTPGLRMVK